MLSEDARVLERVLQYRLLHRRKNQPDVAGISSLRQMRVDAEPRPVGLHEPPEDVFGGFLDVGAARVFGEIPFSWDLGKRASA